jgi:hypothetical protein
MSRVHNLKCDACGKEHPISDHLPPRWLAINEQHHVCCGACLADFAAKVIQQEYEQDRKLDALAQQVVYR